MMTAELLAITDMIGSSQAMHFRGVILKRLSMAGVFSSCRGSEAPVDTEDTGHPGTTRSGTPFAGLCSLSLKAYLDTSSW